MSSNQQELPVLDMDGSTETPMSFPEEIRQTCLTYGLYGAVLRHQPSSIVTSKRNKLYLVASLDPRIGSAHPPDEFDPEYFLRRNKRNEGLFYPDVFVYDLSEKNYVDAMGKLLEYCKYTEFLSLLYDRYHLPAPDKVRRFEIRQLMDAREKQRRAEMDPIWEQATDALNDFFRREQKGGHQKEWLDFFRSGMHPGDVNVLEKLRCFRNRDNQIVSLEQLMSINGHINTLEMQEHEYQRFVDFMRNTYSDIPFSVSKIIEIDNGTGPLPLEVEQTYGKRISGQEYARILEEQFAEMGWECIIGYRPTLFNVRKVSFIASDEPYIASAFQDASLRYARSDNLETIQHRGGQPCLHRIPSDPEEVFMNFVSLAKANGLPFYLDNLGQFESSSLDFINVIYSSRDEALMFSILDRIVAEKVDNSHVVPDNERPSLQETIHRAQLLAPESEGVCLRLDHSNQNNTYTDKKGPLL